MKDPSLFSSVVLTGGQGLVGSAITRVFARRGLPLLVLSHAQCDVTDREAVERMMRTHRPTLVINCAAFTKVDECERHMELAEAVNGRSAGIMADAACQYDAGLIHFSSDFVFDGRSSRPYRADDPPSPLSVYGRAKLLSEQLVQAARGTRGLIVRTSAVFGPTGACFPTSILRQARAGAVLHVVDDQVNCPTYSDDLAECAIDLTDGGATGLWHVAGSEATNWSDFAAAVLEMSAQPAQLIPINTAQWRAMRRGQALRPMQSVLDCDRTERFLGRRMRGWRQTLPEYVVAAGSP